MRNLILLAGTAALALAAPAAAEKGGKGGGHGHGGGKPAKVAQGGGDGGKADRAKRGGGQGARAAKPHQAERQALRAERSARAERRAARRDDRLVHDRRDFRRGGGDRRFEDRRFDDRREFRREVFFRGEPRFAGYGRFCPPGLAKKGNGCLPPGQAKKRFARGQRLDRGWFEGYRIPVSYRSFYYDSPDLYYRYDDDGYIYRVDRRSDLISAIIPLFGGGFGIGQPLPAGYEVYNVPFQYRDTWYDDEDTLYRYGDNAIYRVDAGSGLIEGIVALLAGDLNVGQPLPAGYDVYNVPFDYRDRYYDNDDYLYRYADGNIYQVDAETQLIQAVVEMLV